MDLTKLELLESKVTALLDKKEKAEKRVKELEATLVQTQNSLRQATDQLKTLGDERQVILERVDALLNKIEPAEKADH
ncbi:MAG: cell division protein ZapB [Deltaproteobacteria bacterium]|jgi:signal transduction histidine kinase|nr:cell division protein ZapB [Deltaproteobacteria bacterium]